jgi:hypothetical protein
MRRLLAVGAGFVVALSAAVTTAPGANAPATHSSFAVTYQINEAHTGLQQDDLLRPPLSRRWSHTFPSDVSYPLLAFGKVFVTVRNVSQ